MNQTSNYQLNQYEPTDRVLMESFNADNQKIDAALKQQDANVTQRIAALQQEMETAHAELSAAVAACGNCSIVTGTYVGKGTFGSSNPNTLTFPFEPKLVLIAKEPYSLWPSQMFWHQSFVWVPGCTSIPVNDKNVHIIFTQSGNTLQWYCATNAATQLSDSGQTYRYIAIG